jgi:hypothetical protein
MPSGFILTVILGIAGAFLATFVGQTIGWYRPDGKNDYRSYCCGNKSRSLILEEARCREGRV